MPLSVQRWMGISVSSRGTCLESLNRLSYRLRWLLPPPFVVISRSWSVDHFNCTRSYKAEIILSENRPEQAQAAING